MASEHLNTDPYLSYLSIHFLTRGYISFKRLVQLLFEGIQVNGITSVLFYMCNGIVKEVCQVGKRAYRRFALPTFALYRECSFYINCWFNIKVICHFNPCAGYYIIENSARSSRFCMDCRSYICFNTCLFRLYNKIISRQPGDICGVPETSIYQSIVYLQVVRYEADISMCFNFFHCLLFFRGQVFKARNPSLQPYIFQGLYLFLFQTLDSCIRNHHLSKLCVQFFNL